MGDTEEVQKLRRLLQEAKSRTLEVRRQREGEQCQRGVAEVPATALQPQTLRQYLEACHSLDLAIQVVPGHSPTTQGDTTNPTDRIFPRRIIPWDDFLMKQQEVWDDLSIGTLFSSMPAFPSQNQLEYVKSLFQPFSSEPGLMEFERIAVEHAVQKLVDMIPMDPQLRGTLGLHGTVHLQSHTYLSTTDDDQFCIYGTSEGQKVPVLAIEYKVPHKLSLDVLVTGLMSEIQPERDVINKDGQGFAFTARALAAAIVTQLFSSMIGAGIKYGYICTGEAFVFLYISDDPANVYFSVCVPSLDVMEDDKTRLHRTSVAQVFAFTLQALRTRPPPESWYDEADRLDTWAVDYDKILRKIPATGRKPKEPRASINKPRHWKIFKRSPIGTRSRHKPLDANVRRREDDDEDPPSPALNPPHTSRQVVRLTGSGSGESGLRRGEQQDQGQAAKPNIQSRPFCTQKCLLGLARGWPLDENCPNSHYHKQQAYINRLEFLRLVRDQLATDRGYDADCTSLHRSGARGSLFKVRLSTHGYTLVAKGVKSVDRAYLQHENDMYDRLQAIQGKHVPVCLGSIDLLRPQHFDGGVYNHFLFLGWAGRPLFEYHDRASRAQFVPGVTTIFKAIHELRVLHRDAEPRNMLCEDGTLMVVDFERAEFRGHQPLGSTGANGQDLPGKRGMKNGKDDFATELEFAIEMASTCIASPPRRRAGRLF